MGLIVLKDILSYYQTVNDILLVANAANSKDTSQVINRIAGSQYSGNVTVGSRNGLTLTGNTASVTVSGNYLSKNYTAQPYNIHVYTDSGNASSWRKNNDSLCMRVSWTKISSIEYQNNGILYLTSQAGARTAQNNKDGVPMQDENIRVLTDITTQITGDNYTSYGAPSKTLEVAGYRAEKNLEIASDLIGEVEAKNQIKQTFYTITSGGSTTRNDLSSGSSYAAFAVRADNVTTDNKITGNVNAAVNADILSKVSGSVNDNKLFAAGIYAASDLSALYDITGSFAATTSNSKIVADGGTGNMVSSVVGGTTFNGNVVSMTGVEVAASAIQADGVLSIARLGELNGQTAALTAKSETITLSIESYLQNAAATGATATGNTLSATAIKGGTVAIGTIEEGVKLNASINGSKLHVVAVGGGTFGNTISVGGNAFNVAGIWGDTVNLYDFCGDIKASADNVDFTWSISGGSVGYVGGTTTLTAAGIRAGTLLQSDGSLSGTINVSAKNVHYSYLFGPGNVKLVSAGIIAGIYAPAISIKGRIDTDISVVSHNNEGLDVGIVVGTLSAEAISGNINAEFGVNVKSQMLSSISNDALDISGSITASDTAIYTGTGGAANLRISGSLKSGTAIETEVYASNKSLLVVSDITRKDMIEVAAGGIVDGTIELRTGVNSLILDSSAVVKGDTKASGGQMNYVFLLNEAAKNAVITTKSGIGDDLDNSLKSNSTVSVNLDFAKNSGSYTLFNYNANISTSVIASAWNNRQISFIYHGEMKTAVIKNNTATVNFGSTSATITVSDHDIVISNISGVAAIDKLKVKTGYEGKFDSATATYTVSGLDIEDRDNYENLEVEYTINGGKSVVQRLGNAITSFTISGVHENDKVAWKIRGVSVADSCATYYRKMSDWFTGADELHEVVPSNIDVSGVSAYASGGYTDYRNRERVESAVALFFWNAPVSTYAIDHYVLQYYESATELSQSEATSKLENSPDTVSKTTTAAEIAASGLNSFAYIYWRIQAVDVNGVASEWVKGESFHTYYGDDKTKPEIYDISVEAEPAAKEDYNDNLAVTVAWKAKDNEGGTGLSSSSATLTNGTTSVTKSFLGDVGVNDCTWTFTGLAAGTYTCVINAYDNVLNKATSKPYTVTIGDLTGPTFSTTGITSTSVPLNPDNWNDKCDVTISWDAATDDESGVKNYQVVVTSGTVTVGDQTVAHVEGQSKYSCTFKNLNGSSSYTYTITVSDQVNNTTAVSDTLVCGDHIAPTFPDQNVSVYSYRCNPDNYLKMAVVLSWDEATDEGGSGLMEYTVTVTSGSQVQTMTVDKYTTSCTVEDVDAGDISWSVTATDRAGNTSTAITGTHRTESAPVGNFINVNAPVIEITHGGTVTPGSSSTELPFESASAWFTWNDTYTDAEDGVYYRVQISDNTDFINRVYEYKTTVNGEDSLMLDQTPTLAVGSLSALSYGSANIPLYYRVMAINGKGEETGIWSAVQQFYFADGTEGIKHVTDPDEPKNVTVSLTKANYCCNGVLNIGWINEQTDLGISSYTLNVICTNKEKNTRIIPITNGDVEIPTASGTASTYSELTGSVDLAKLGCLSGEYALSVTAYNAIGKSTTSDSVAFTLDMVRPTAVTLQTTSAKNDIAVTWDASYDAFGIAYYEIMYRRTKADSEEQDAWTLYKKCTNRSFLISELGEGYGFDICVYAYDNNGNRSNRSEIIQTVSTSDGDLCDYYAPTLWENLDDISSSGNVQNTIGVSDKADYFYFTSDLSLSLTTVTKSLTALYGNNKGVKVSVYKYDGSGYEKAVATYTLSKSGDKKSNVLLTKGTYYVKITAKDQKTISNYKLNFQRSTFANKTVNNSADNNWKTLDTSAYPVCYVGNMATVTAKKDWVGFGDSIDYRVLQTEYAGRFTVSLMNVSAPVTLTVYENNNGSLKKITSVSASKGNNSVNVLLESKNTKTYYVKVTATQASSGKNTWYSWKVTAVSQYKKGNNADDNWKTMDTSKYSLSYNKSFSDWVGFGDTIDYRKLDLTDSGKYKLTISNVTNPVNVAVYQLVWSNGSQKLQKIKSATLTSGSKTLSNLLLESNNTADYYVSVKATKASTAQNTSYKLKLSGTVYDAAGANNEDDSWQLLDTEKYSVSCGDTVTDEWVGLGDEIDYRLLTLDYAGMYTFRLSDVTKKTTLTIYQQVGSSLTAVKKLTVKSGSGSIKNLLLESSREATYYIGVSSNNAAEAQNSSYQLAVSGTEYSLGRTGDDWNDLVSKGPDGAVGSFGEIDQDMIGTTLDREDDKTGERGFAANWVGFGDAVDYVGFSVQERSSELYFDVQTTGSIEFTVYQLVGEAGNFHLATLQRTVFTQDGTTDKLLLDGGGDYYVGISSLTADKGGSANYSVGINAMSQIHVQPYNGDDTWRQMIRATNYTVLDKNENMPISGWVGYGDPADYHKFQQWQQATMALRFDDVTGNAISDGQLEVCVIDSNGVDQTDQFRRIDDYNWITDGEMLGGIYYVGFTCTDTDKYNTYYKATLSIS